MVRETALYRDLKIELFPKDTISYEKDQIQGILDLYHQGIDVLIVFPYDINALTPVISEIFDKGIPVIDVDRKLNTDKFTAFIGSDNLDVGEQAGLYVVKMLKAGGNIIEIKGAAGSSSSIERSLGFKKIIDQHPSIRTISAIYGNWDNHIVEHRIDSVLQKGTIPDLIFAHNDEMALKAAEVCRRYKIKPIIIGVDGLPIKGGGIDMVLNNQIDATFFNRTGGDIAIQLAVNIMQHKKVNKFNLFKTFAIDKNNAKALKVQYDLLDELHVKIQKQQSKINTLTQTILNQKTLLILSIAFGILLVLVASIILYYLRQKQKYIYLIDKQKEQIEAQMKEQKILTEKLIQGNKILQEHEKEIIKQNITLKKYGNDLENMVRERTQELQNALNKAEESDRLKTSFLANLSHEIRTPLNAILGFSSLICERNMTDDEQKKYKTIIESSGDGLLSLINDIIDFSKIEAGHLDIIISDISIVKVLNEIEQIFRLEIKKHQYNLQKDIELKTNIDDKISSLVLRTDEIRLKQILSNLIGNAIKYTDKGFIEVGCNVLDAENMVEFYVKDTGIGIDKDQQKIIFQRFRKAENDNANLYRGAGLGLSISKHLVSLLGGQIRVESNPGEGSVFYFTLPLNH